MAPPSFFAKVRRAHRHNVATLRRAPLAELSGALGDLGTLLPLLIALAVNGSVALAPTLVFSGAFNVATGAAFGVPLPVQPMKAIAAAAVASRASLRETMAAGSVTAGAVLALAATGLLRGAARWVPVPVVKGIQFGAGLSLTAAAGPALLRPLPWAAPRPLDNRLWALAAFAALVATQRRPRVPYALGLFLLGLALALVVLATDHLGFDRAAPHRLPGFGPWRPEAGLPRWTPDAVGLGLAQLPLTTLNSVLAASALAADLLPHLPAPSVTALGFSVAAMNLTGCWFGAMPVCHGAGGLAAQYRFGARSGASVVLLGLFKLALGLLFGETLLDLLTAFPHALLGVMVLASGLELAKVGQSLNHGAADLWEEASATSDGNNTNNIKRHRDLSDDERAERWTVMLLTTAGILAFKNDLVGFLAGMFCHYAYRAADWLDARRRRAALERTPLLNT